MATTRYIGRERDHHREAILRQKQTVRDDEEDAYSRARLAVSSAPLCQSLPDFTVVIEVSKFSQHEIQLASANVDSNRLM